MAPSAMPEQLEVGGRTYRFGKLAPADAVPVLWKLLPLMPTIVQAIATLQAKVRGAATAVPGAEPTEAEMAAELAAAFSDDNLETLVMAIVSKISGAEVFSMMQTLFKSVTLVMGGAVLPVDANTTFGDGVSKDSFAVFGNALRVNFAGFLAGAGSPSNPVAPTT